MCGKRYSSGKPCTTKRSRWLSAAARMPTRTSRGPGVAAGGAGGGTSVSSSRSRPPVARITQARIGGLGQERRSHHQLEIGRASCRERVENRGVGVGIKEEKRR